MWQRFCEVFATATNAASHSMKKKLLLIVSACLFLTGIMRAQTSIIDSIQLYNTTLPQEKMYVHFDNNGYLPGQDIGFKVYLMNGPALSKLSFQLYTDWYNDAGELLAHQVSPIALSSAYGTFSVPQDYRQQRLHMVAYTKWMLNLDTAFLYRKTFPIIQSESIADTEQTTFRQYQFNLFPEGGYSVNGILGNMAFKATDPTGKPVNVRGAVLDQHGDTVVRFASIHDGMGMFSLKPEEGKQYTCSWWGPNGQVHNIPVPEALKQGIVVRMNPTGSIRTTQLELSEDVPAHLKKLTMLVMRNQEVVIRATVNVDQERTILSKLPLLNIPSGTAVFTLLDANQVPIVERPFFIDNEEYVLDVSLNTDTINFDKRGRNVYEIVLPDSIPTNMSLSITTGDFEDEGVSNILTDLLVSSEIKGHVHNPGYYFDMRNPSGIEHLDLVMLTNGWRRIRWDLALNPSSIRNKHSRDTGYLSLIGKIDGLNEKRLTKAETINLMIKGKSSSFQMAFPEVTPTGDFHSNDLFLFDTSSIFYQLNNLQNLPGRGKVSITTNLMQGAAFNRFPYNKQTFVYDSLYLQTMHNVAMEQTRLKQLMKETTLEEVVVKTYIKSRIEQLEEDYTTGLYRGGDSYSFDVINDPRSQSTFTIFDYLRGRVPGITINDMGPDVSVQWRGQSVTFFLNEMPVNISQIASVNLNDIAYIKAFRPPFFGSGLKNDYNGAVALYTKKGKEFTSSVKGLDNITVTGYTTVKEFYQPDYSDINQLFDKTDLRRTLVWKPNIITDGSVQKINIAFYNNDVNRKFVVTLEGINDQGKMIAVRKLLQE